MALNTYEIISFTLFHDAIYASKTNVTKCGKETYMLV